MKKLRLYIFMIFISLSFSGCATFLAFAGGAVSLLTTSQEVNEDYDGDIEEYISDKYEKTTEYIRSNAEQEE